MPKPRYKTTNWKQYYQALINRGAITQWKANAEQPGKGRRRVFNDLAMMVKRVFSMPLRALQGFINSVFKLGGIPTNVSTLHLHQQTRKNGQYCF